MSHCGDEITPLGCVGSDDKGAPGTAARKERGVRKERGRRRYKHDRDNEGEPHLHMSDAFTLKALAQRSDQVWQGKIDISDAKIARRTVVSFETLQLGLLKQ
jgi:hypothetical protein